MTMPDNSLDHLDPGPVNDEYHVADLILEAYFAVKNAPHYHNPITCVGAAFGIKVKSERGVQSFYGVSQEESDHPTPCALQAALESFHQNVDDSTSAEWNFEEVTIVGKKPKKTKKTKGKGTKSKPCIPCDACRTALASHFPPHTPVILVSIDSFEEEHFDANPLVEIKTVGQLGQYDSAAPTKS